MNKKKAIIFMLVFATISCFSTLSAQTNSKGRYTPRSKQVKPHAFGIHGAMEYYSIIRHNQITKLMDYEDYYNALSDLKKVKAGKSTNLTWESVGPTNIAGRVRGLIIDKNNFNTLYAGAVSGGLWKTTNGAQSWFKIDDFKESLIVSCLAQAPNGIIYFGTGEGFAPNPGSNAGGTGFVGKGVFRSTNASGTEFVHLPSTSPTLDIGWEYVYEILVHPNGDIYAATQRGFRKSSDGGETWINPLTDIDIANFPNAYKNLEANDVNIHKNGNVIALVIGNRVLISTDGGNSYRNNSTGGNMLPSSGLSRIELDIAPSDPNYIYACAAKMNGTLHNVYRTTNAGQTWEIIGPGGSENFNPLGVQGRFDNVIRVHPTNKNKIYVGGLDMWTWEENGNWEAKSFWPLSPFSPYYLHADHHEYIFHPENPNIMFFATDGGISKSTNGGNTFETVNRNFVSTQFYAIGIGPNGEILGGTQDNGTLFIDRKGFVEGRADHITGGDGGYSVISQINPDLLFSTIYYGAVYRTPNRSSATMAPFFDDFMNSLNPGPGNQNFASFVTPIILHEKINDYFSPDSVTYTHTGDTVQSGETIFAFSNTSGYAFPYVLPEGITLAADDTIRVQDIVTSKFYLGATNRVFMTRESHKFSGQSKWFQIANISGTTQSMTVSHCGNYVFVGTQNGNVYRISNLNFANDSLSASVTSDFRVIEVKQFNILGISGRSINKIAVDPNNPERLIVVLGNYGNNLYVYFSANALSAEPTFVQKQGNLPRMPVYSAIFDISNPNRVILGTEFGIFVTDNITVPSPQWATDTDGGLPNVPVYDLKQQTFMFPGVTNYGVIYAGTHGRGIFESFSLVNIPETYETSSFSNNSLLVYPNPTQNVISFDAPNTQVDINLAIYSINGNLLKNKVISKGSKNYTINVSDLPNGLYFIQLSNADFYSIGRFIKQ